MAQKEKNIYRNLQKHLDKQPVGYPATKSGSDIRVLKGLFKPEEAEIAMKLNYKPRSLEQIHRDAGESGIALEKLKNFLDEMSKNGLIGYLEKDGIPHFYNTPLVVGMYEGQLYKLTPELLSDFEDYAKDKTFGLEFLSSKLPQMRTIPIEKSITPEHHVATYDHLMGIIESTKGPFFINECICRKSSAVKGNPCQQTSRLETCLAIGDMAKTCIRSGLGGREITRDEAIDISFQNQEEGLVLQPNNAQQAEFICACCGCCCGILQMQKTLPKPIDFWSTNYYAKVDAEDCTGCGTCLERCQTGAISINEKLNISRVNLNRCVGCGNCVTSCETGAMSLVKKERELVPPKTPEELFDIIMANKKGKIGKARLAAKLMLKI